MARDNESLATIEELKARARGVEVEMSPRICLNMSHFKAVMKHLRKVDDNIVLRMNTTNTEAAGECLAMFQIMQAAYQRRDRDIGMCLGVLDRKIEEAKVNDHQESSSQRRRGLFALEAQRDWMANESGVEDIVRKRSLDVFRSRCQFFELPPEFEKTS